MPYQKSPQADKAFLQDRAMRGGYGAAGFVASLPELEGNPNYVQVGSKVFTKSQLLEVLATPEGKQWMQGIDPSLDFAGTDEIRGGMQYITPPPIEFKLGDLATIAITQYRFPDWALGGGVKAQEEQVRQGVLAGRGEGRGELPPEIQYSQFLEGVKPTVSPARFRYMESIFPELSQKFRASVQVTPKGEVSYPQTWAEFIKKYQFEQEFSGLTPEQRGFRGGFQPLIRQVGR